VYEAACDTGKVNVYYKIVIENQKKKRKYGNQSLKDGFRNGIHSAMTENAGVKLQQSCMYKCIGI